MVQSSWLRGSQPTLSAALATGCVTVRLTLLLAFRLTILGTFRNWLNSAAWEAAFGNGNSLSFECGVHEGEFSVATRPSTMCIRKACAEETRWQAGTARPYGNFASHASPRARSPSTPCARPSGTGTELADLRRRSPAQEAAVPVRGRAARHVLQGGDRADLVERRVSPAAPLRRAVHQYHAHPPSAPARTSPRASASPKTATASSRRRTSRTCTRPDARYLDRPNRYTSDHAMDGSAI